MVEEDEGDEEVEEEEGLEEDNRLIQKYCCGTSII